MDKKRPSLFCREGYLYYIFLLEDRSLTMTYFHMASATLSSALTGFTTEFEMGSGGSRSLWSSGETGKLKSKCLGVIWSSHTDN